MDAYVTHTERARPNSSDWWPRACCVPASVELSLVDPVDLDFLAAFQEFIDGHGRDAAVRRRDHHLLVWGVADVADRVDPFDPLTRSVLAVHVVRHHHAAVLLKRYVLALQELGHRLRSGDVDEDALHLQMLLRLRALLLQLDLRDARGVALDLEHARLAPMLDVGRGEQRLRMLVVRLRVRLRDPVHRRRELGQVLRLLDRLPVHSHHRHLAVAIEGAVTRRAVADATA
mmetsp:Transcript_32447/g.82737  ORF Transcript_32447/g.82737 Transcript_32447/m.82737 type:complete len:230 (-) Transcript_32447:537-1226(-)